MDRLRLIIGLLIVAAVVLFFLGATTYTDWLWFLSLGYQRIFLTGWLYRLAVGAAFAAATFIFLAANILLAKKLAPNVFFVSRNLEIDRLLSQLREKVDRYLGSAAYLISGGVAIAAGVSLGAGWETWLRFFFSAPTGTRDPIFRRDIAFYFFSLPVFELVQGYLVFLLFISAVLVSLIYLARGSFHIGRGWRTVDSKARIHLSVLASMAFVLLASHWWLSRYRLLYSARGAVFGAGYTDVNVFLPAYSLLALVALAAAVLAIVYGLTNRPFLVIAPVGALAAVWLVGTAAWPFIVQQYRVAPNEIAREKPYIARSIEFTRKAFALDKVGRSGFPADQALSKQDVDRNQETIDSIRLWDWRPLKKTYSQIQEIRLYYNFRDVDLDRYPIQGRTRQMALSARELVADQLPESARTWINRHLVYTHGYGLVASPVNKVAGEGLPELVVKNIPPKSSAPALDVIRPQIYFGEATNDYSVVGTEIREFDYPAGDRNKYTKYKGKDGISLSNTFVKLAFAYRYGTAKLFFSEALTPSSRILIHRNIRERLRTLAPFLTYDEDPYIVVSKGRLFWIMDAYTMTNRYPYSKPAAAGQNYLRNSVKVVVDAYEGTVRFYIADPADPIIKTYARAFPGVFRDLKTMDKGLQKHLRYPEELFKIQSEIYAAFHMDDPQVFYNKEDLWEIPKEIYDNETIMMEPYYTYMQLPGEKSPEFVLILPFTPTNKANMIAWLAARSDPPHYGQLKLYSFPKDKLIFGPMQVEARLDQDPDISRQLSLWNQRGSRVIRGNLLVVPIADSVLYVEPIYLQAEASELPELKRVALGLGDKVVMEPSFDKALSRLLGTKPPPEQPPSTGKPPAGDKGLIDRANEAFKKAEEAQKRGDWAEYGRQLKNLREALEALAQ